MPKPLELHTGDLTATVCGRNVLIKARMAHDSNGVIVQGADVGELIQFLEQVFQNLYGDHE